MYRMMQANLKFLSSDKDLKIVVTSSVPQEGKSTVSAIWLQPWVRGKVLLIDADMRLLSNLEPAQ